MPRLPNLPVWSDKRREARAFVLKSAYEAGVYNYAKYSTEVKKLITVEKNAVAKRQAKQEIKEKTKEQQKKQLKTLATKLRADAKPKKGVVDKVEKYKAKDTGYWTKFSGEKVYMKGMVSARHFDYKPALFVNYPFRNINKKYGYEGYNIYTDGSDIARKVSKDIVKNIRPAKTATHIYIIRVEFKLYVEQKNYEGDTTNIPKVKETDKNKYLNRHQIGDLIQDDDGVVFKIEERRFIAYQNTYNKTDMLDTIKDEIEHEFDKDYGKIYNVIGYDIILIKQPTKAGCDGREHSITINDKFICISPKTTNRNCLFACINKSMDIKNNVRKPDTMRQECNIKPNTLITLAQHEVIAKKYDLTITTYGITGSVIQTVGNGSHLVKIMMIVGNADG